MAMKVNVLEDFHLDFLLIDRKWKGNQLEGREHERQRKTPLQLKHRAAVAAEASPPTQGQFVLSSLSVSVFASVPPPVLQIQYH